MSIVISRTQEIDLDAIARQRFLDDLFEYITEAFPDDDANERSSLFDACLSACAHTKIITEYGINAFVVLSFMAENCLTDDTDFLDAQAAMVARTGEPERLVELLFESNFPE